MSLTVRLVVLIALVVVGGVGACESKSPAPVRPLLWSVEKDGKTSYLFGTMHRGVNPSRVPALVWHKLEASRVLAVETDVSQAASLPVLRTDGSSLMTELGPAYWKKLEDTLGIDTASRLVGFKPVIPAMLVAMHGMPETLPIDGELEHRARTHGKPIVYLETVDAQFAVLEKWFDTRALRDMLDDIAQVEKVSKLVVTAYVEGDPDKMLAVTARERERWLARGRTQSEYDAQMEDILYRRNASWIDGIEKLHADGGAFIGVGALHLVGPRSVVDLLTQRGYAVKRILPDGAADR